MLTKAGREKARRFNDKMNIALSFLIDNGGVYSGIYDDAADMALALSDEALKRMTGQRRVQLKRKIDRELIEGYSIAKYFEDGTYMADVTVKNLKTGIRKVSGGKSYIKIFAEKGIVYVDSSVFEGLIEDDRGKKTPRVRYCSFRGDESYEAMPIGKVVCFPMDEMVFACFSDSKIFLGDIKLEVDCHKIDLQIIIKYM